MLCISRFWGVSLAALAAVALTACGGSGTSSGDTGRLSLYVTDAPVDDASAVVVAFTGVELKPADGEPIGFSVCDPETAPETETETATSDPSGCEGGVRKIDLLKLTGDESVALLGDVELPAGRYEWIRLEVLTSRTSTDDSFIVINDVPRPLWVPSGEQSGLKLVQGFTVPAGGIASFTIDFDLRKSITNPQGPFLDTYFLRPALRLVDNKLTGHLEGDIAAELVEGEACFGTEPSGLGVVYVFEADGEIGHEIDLEGAVTSTKVDSIHGDTETSYSYRVGFLPAMEGGTEYLVQLWCETPDDVDVDRIWLAEEFADVFPGETTPLDFDADAP